MITRRLRSADGVTITFEHGGERQPAIVFVHGWSCDRSYWRHQLSMDDRFKIVTLDLAGHGSSGSSRVRWTMQAYGNDVAAVVDELEMKDVILVGHSMGGNACLEAARRREGSVRGIVLVDVYGTLDVPAGTPSVDEFTAPFRDDFVASTKALVASMFLPGEDPAIASSVIDDMSAAPPQIALESIVASLTYGRTAYRVIDAAEIPMVAINSDWLGSDVESLESHGVDVLHLPGSGHFPMLTDVGRFNALLAETVSELLLR